MQLDLTLILNMNIHLQLVQNGKKVVMMGDDTWTQLFPHHFERSYPYPSFNVKDLDMVGLILCWAWFWNQLLILAIHVSFSSFCLVDHLNDCNITLNFLG